ncbi:hypothetical protein GEM_0993 [Burkholderia cepacia GG4]|uniref:Uncharacterized protein n=1 Tax=Burkholderia cepacia GG4 TaxID=1009846 RepID=A0A9W3P8J6_BURCE|nr:hypothetical protein GEM_0993 [Burkholderia cepacia GG4]
MKKTPHIVRGFLRKAAGRVAYFTRMPGFAPLCGSRM